MHSDNDSQDPQADSAVDLSLPSEARATEASGRYKAIYQMHDDPELVKDIDAAPYDLETLKELAPELDDIEWLS